ncbi:enoyl-CoA hydratase-related protein [Azotobacter salinestris]|uniref:enoyl-CoA hydratase-related protein n=1 Tax=Azotobacter salinestris TaxID=69964 RepID=UPI001FCB3C59|nr:enoyl-CoA hydratase-related protein [Azotobacter salinestris]
MYNGKAIRLKSLEDGLVELILDLQGSSVNKLNSLTLGELAEVVRLLERHSHEVEGLLIASAKPVFGIGTDVTEFTAAFSRSEGELLGWVRRGQALFSALENLPFPTVAAVNGLALGGGFELALAADFRVLAVDARVGLPEVKLGVCPSCGGTVRLSRLIGAEAALDWLLSGTPNSSALALEQGAVDRIVAADKLRGSALNLLRMAANGELPVAAYRARKQQPPRVTPESQALLAAVQQHHAGKLDPHYPAPEAILTAVVRQAVLSLDEALELEARTFAALAKIRCRPCHGRTVPQRSVGTQKSPELRSDFCAHLVQFQPTFCSSGGSCSQP